MNTQQLDTSIRSHIDQFLVSISALVRQAAVEAVREALGAGDGMVAAPARRGPGRPRKVAAAAASAPKARAEGKRGRRSSADVEQVAAQVRDYVSANPGQRLEEIGRGLGADTAGLKRPIQGLLAAGELRTEGQKRGTKYFPGGKGGGPKGKASKVKRTGRKAGKRTGRAGSKKAARSGRKVAKAAVLLQPEVAEAA